MCQSEWGGKIIKQSDRKLLMGAIKWRTNHDSWRSDIWHINLRRLFFFCHFIEFNDVSLIKVPMLCTTCEKKNFRQILCNVILYTQYL